MQPLCITTENQLPTNRKWTKTTISTRFNGYTLHGLRNIKRRNKSTSKSSNAWNSSKSRWSELCNELFNAKMTPLMSYKRRVHASRKLCNHAWRTVTKTVVGLETLTRPSTASPTHNKLLDKAGKGTIWRSSHTFAHQHLKWWRYSKKEKTKK